MSEAAPYHPEGFEQSAETNRQFELITNDFFDGPDGPFFVLKWEQELEISELLKRQSRIAGTKEGKPVINNGRQLLLAVFDQVGLVEDSNRIDDYRQARNGLIANGRGDWSEEDEHLFNVLDGIVRLNDVTVSLVQTADQVYQSEYWEDYQHKTGQNWEKLDELYNKTEAYEESGLLSSLREIRQAGFSEDIVLEADRIARILIVNEIEQA